MKYFISTRYIGIEAKIDVTIGLIAYTNSDFANSQNKLDPERLENLFSRTGYVIYFIGMPIVWCSKL